MRVVARLLGLVAFVGPAYGAPLAREAVGRTVLPEPRVPVSVCWPTR